MKNEITQDNATKYMEKHKITPVADIMIHLDRIKKLEEQKDFWYKRNIEVYDKICDLTDEECKYLETILGINNISTCKEE